MLRKLLILGAILCAGAMPAALAQVQPDKNAFMPEITKEWKTLSTPHFHIHHEAHQKAFAQYLATIAERVHGKLTPWLDWQPQDPTEVVLLDTIDASNGHASPFPFNNISIYMTPPVDGETMDQTPWLEFVFIHEYVHILHLDTVHDVPRMMRNVFGRSMGFFTLLDFPELFAPTWVTEGLAVYGESDNPANYGRLNGAYFEALMRMEVQRGLYSMTEVSFNSTYRWPYGQVYLYGSYFFKFVETRYGRDAVTNYIRVYSSNLIPFRMQTRSEQVFGKSAEVVWSEFQQYLQQRFAPQLETIKQQNRFVTHAVYDVLTNNSALTPAANGDLYFVHDDYSSRPQIMRIRADGSNEALLDGRGVQDLDWHETSGLLMTKYAVCDNTNMYFDLYLWKPAMKTAQQLTHCGRFNIAIWRPDGQAIAAIQTERGISRLLLLDAQGNLLEVLAELPMGETLGQLDWSPDGKTLVASVQRQKTGWNLELFDVRSRHWQALTSGNDLVQRPQFSKDGSEIHFLSDHDKVWNLRRLKLAGHMIDTISNTASVITEAVQMPDNSYRLVEYTPGGKIITALDSTTDKTSSAYPAKPKSVSAVSSISNAPDYQPYPYQDVTDYSPWHTLKPHSWFPLWDTTAEQASYAGIMLNGSDALNFHTWNATPLYYYDQKIFGGVANYSFYNNITLSAQRQLFIWGAPTATVRYRDDEVRYQALLHHSFNTIESRLYVAGGVANETLNAQVIKGSATDQEYHNKISGAIAQYDNSRIYKNSIAPVEGRRVQLLSESYDLLGGSDFTGKTSRIDWNEYFALGGNYALHLRLLRAEGDPGIRPYFLGGTSEVLSKIGGETGLGRRDFPLRGYPSGLASLSGSNMGLFTAEWKIPLGYHYDGWFVPPVGIGRESLTLFVDSGDAWYQGDAVEAKTGIGMEWNFEALLGYDLLHISTTIGVARGVDVGGENRLYFRVTLPL